MKIKTGDTVVVIAGKDSKQVTKKGVESTTGKVLKVYPETNKVVVEGVNVHKKHRKPTQQYRLTGTLMILKPHTSITTIMFINPSTIFKNYFKFIFQIFNTGITLFYAVPKIFNT